MTPSRADADRILRARAAALARPMAEAPVVTDRIELLVVALGGERYGIETAHVLEVLPLREMTAVPCTPAFIAGVLNYRGRLLAVLDFRPLFDLPGDEAAARRVVAVHISGMTFGILAEATAGPIAADADELAPPPGTLPVNRRVLIRGMTHDMVAVLDVEALARDPRIQVNDDWGE